VTYAARGRCSSLISLPTVSFHNFIYSVQNFPIQFQSLCGVQHHVLHKLEKTLIRKSISFALGTALIGISSLTQAADYEVTVTNLTAGIHFTPLIVSAHSPDASMFNTGTQASTEMQAIAEGGDVAPMAALLESIGASVATGTDLIAPGASTTFTVSSSDVNTVVSLTGMLLPTNDGFVGLNSVSLPTAKGQSVHFSARGYDAGTEANNELVGSGAPGEAGFPAPPPLVATGLLGTDGTGVDVEAEGFVTIHRGVLGDLDPAGGFSDINAAIHRWSNPVAGVMITMVGDDGNDGDSDGPSAVTELRGSVYSSTAVEIFWGAAESDDASIVNYEIKRDGELIETTDGQSFFENDLKPVTDYTYEVRAIDSNGNAGEYQSVVLTTKS